MGGYKRLQAYIQERVSIIEAKQQSRNGFIPGARALRRQGAQARLNKSCPTSPRTDS